MKAVKIATLIVLLLGAAFLAVAMVGSRGVSVVVCNGSSDTIENVELAFTGGVRHVPSILPNAESETRIVVEGESDLRLKYASGSSSYAYRLDEYIEPGYCGLIRISVGDSGDVSAVDCLYCTGLNYALSWCGGSRRNAETELRVEATGSHS